MRWLASEHMNEMISVHNMAAEERDNQHLRMVSQVAQTLMRSK